MPLTYVPQNVNTQRNTFSNASCVDDRRSLSVAQRVVQRNTGVVQKTNEDLDAFEKGVFKKEIAEVKKIVKFKKIKLSTGFFNGKSVILHMDKNEENKEMIKESVVDWLKQMEKVIPDGLNVYVSNAFERQRSFNYGRGKICLRTNSMKNLMSYISPPIAEKIAEGDLKKFTDVTLRHELGHILHRKCCDDFHTYTGATLGKNGVNQERINHIRDNVSRYAIQGCLTEFVAEVFAGLSSGVSFDERVIEVYKRFGGPCQEYLVKNESDEYILRI